MMKRGSALLIVLGMLAFMVVSAVAFSMFMRQNRLPSSFLRQQIAASQLVKSGLACAMRELDVAIADNPYPGVGITGNKNYWKNRVFLGSLAATNLADDDEPDYETVSTLTLEALAYLPPPLVDTVRYWSKRTPTAAWSALGYDAGRYAYTAVNVSDYFDISSLPANVMRDSSPARRISMAYLFENAQHTGDGTVSPKAFDAFIGKSTNDTFKTRFVSLADYNLAIDSRIYGDVGFESPFCEYIKSPPKDGSFYGAGTEDAKRQKFITDSWYPGTNATGIVLTDDANGQPIDHVKQSLDALQRIDGGNQAFRILREKLDICTLGALYDYIDEDSVPISLAIPTLEHVPMITGISITPENIKVELDSKKGDPEKKGTQENPQTWRRKAWWVKSLGDQGARVTCNLSLAYPFKRTSGVTRKSSYEVQVLVRVFLSSTGEKFEETRLASGMKPGKGDWKAANGLAATDKAYLTLFGSKNVSVTEGTDESHCAIDVTGLELEIPADAFAKAFVYGAYYQEDDNGNVLPDTFTYDASSATLALAPNQKKLLYRDIKNKKGVEVGDSTGELRLNYAVWARVVDGDDTVDLVPAMMSDDEEYNNHDSGSMDTAKICGGTEPIFPLAGGNVLKLDLATFRDNDGAQASDVQGSLAVYCDDPRYNYAPEDWYTTPNGQVQASEWFSAAKQSCAKKQTEALGFSIDGDIFQFVSDEGYLQSLGEFQFLPYIRSFATTGNPFSGDFFNSGKYNGKPFAERTSSEQCVNKEYVWETHWSFGKSADYLEGANADPYSWGIADANGGQLISPYADQDLLMAAFANTPYDWIVASENDKMELSNGRKYCFGPASTEAKIEWTKLEEFAKAFKNKVGSNTNWEEVFREGFATENPFGVDLGTDLDGVDRKFLYSYWKSCLGNSQQLFLVFVRAEPTVMGGSSAGHTPAQLGARAVALVWREPTSTIADTTESGTATAHPHRMRILFYHQFD